MQSDAPILGFDDARADIGTKDLHLALERIADARADGTKVKRGNLVFMAALLMTATGCAKISETKVRTASPDPARSSYVEDEKELGAVEVEVTSGDGVIQIKATREVRCRQASITPQVGKETTHRKLESPAQMWVAGVSGAVLVAGGGAAIFVGQHTGDSSKKSPAIGIGAATIGIGAAALVAVLVNGIRAADSTEEVPAEPARAPGTWKRCGAKPADGVDVKVQFPDGTMLVGRSDANGVARVGLEGVTPSIALLKSQQAKVLVGSSAVHTIDLSTMKIFALEKKRMQEAAVAEAAQAEQRRLREQRERFGTAPLPTAPGFYRVERGKYVKQPDCHGNECSACATKSWFQATRMTPINGRVATFFLKGPSISPKHKGGGGPSIVVLAVGSAVTIVESVITAEASSGDALFLSFNQTLAPSTYIVLQRPPAAEGYARIVSVQGSTCFEALDSSRSKLGTATPLGLFVVR